MARSPSILRRCLLLVALALLARVTLSPAPGGEPEESVEVRYDLGEVQARPGELVEVPLRIRTNTHLAMVSWTVEYDPRFLELLGPVLSPQLLATLAPDDGDSLLASFHDPDEGWVQLVLVADFQGRQDRSLPPGILETGTSLRFRVLPAAVPATLPLVFTRAALARFDGHFHDGDRQVYNAARQAGTAFGNDDLFAGILSPDLDDGAIVVGIIGDVGIFTRGDATFDGSIDLSDPVRILDALFRGGPPLVCLEAADANDDGRVDLSDAITLLGYLFTGRPRWEPSPVDPAALSEEEDLGCGGFAPGHGA